MKRISKIFKRVLITSIAMITIYLCVDGILTIKYKSKLNSVVSGEWGWNEEHLNYYHLYSEKYEREDENKLLILTKNSYVSEKEEDEKRILVVGDSFIYGIGGTNINYLWWGQLNWRLKEAGYNNVKVYAAGFYNYNTKEELENILNNDKLIENIDPDLVIIGHLINDPEEHNEDGSPTIEYDWERIKENSSLYKKNPTLYYELVDRLHAMDVNKYDELLKLGDMLGGHRWDVWSLYIVQDERLERYRDLLKKVDDRMKELDIPYMFAFTNFVENKLVDEAVDVVQTEMKKIGINYFSIVYNDEKIMNKMNISDHSYLLINPVDDHPGIMLTYEYSVKLFEELKRNYSFIFDDSKKSKADELELNINDTMPFLDVKKIKKNLYEFVYPEKETVKEKENSNFLYYPLEKNYVKINLDYPRNIKKIKITGDNLEAAEVYVNTINEKYGFDYDEAFKKLTPCKYILNNTYSVNKKITSVNIHAVFKSEEDRNLEIEFVE